MVSTFLEDKIDVHEYVLVADNKIAHFEVIKERLGIFQ